MEEGRRYDFEERSFAFALDVRRCVADRRWNRWQWPDVNQLLRASGSIAANYIEANNAVSRPDFLHRLRIAKKEAAESFLWLRLLKETTSQEEASQPVLHALHREADELTRILATILRNSLK